MTAFADWTEVTAANLPVLEGILTGLTGRVFQPPHTQQEAFTAKYVGYSSGRCRLVGHNLSDPQDGSTDPVVRDFLAGDRVRITADGIDHKYDDTVDHLPLIG